MQGARSRLLRAVLLALAAAALPAGCELPDYQFEDSVQTARVACDSDADCAELPATKLCDPWAGWCVECSPSLEADTDRCADGAYCTPENRCSAGCGSDEDCGAGLACDVATHRCVGCETDADCPPGTGCGEAAECVPRCESDEACPTGFSCCDGRCENLTGDPLHCGGCGAACADGNECLNSACERTSCRSGFASCDGQRQNGCETDLANDARHCGTCSVDCTPGTCSGGRCGSMDCPDGTADCDAVPDNGCETDLQSPASCGTCTNRCGAAQGTATCVDETCGIVCNPGFGDCDLNTQTGCETDLTAAREHCGGCGVACKNEHGSTRCDDGLCVPVCAAGFEDCDGNPTNGCESAIDSSLEHCGACGNDCALASASEVCTQGVCSIVECDAGFADCDGAPGNGCEADLSSTETCGHCETACNGNGGRAACEDGECRIECDEGRADCENDLLDGCETRLSVRTAHCGECGERCASPATGTAACFDGECGVSPCELPSADCEDESEPGDETCETDTEADAQNCGGCGIECAYFRGTGVCEDGACELAECDPGFAQCDDELANGCETRLGTTKNCTACNEKCTNDHGETSCTEAGCTPICAIGWGDCNGNPQDGCETSLDSLAHCGACDTRCSKPNATATCSTGSCEIEACRAGFDDCDDEAALETGCETNLRTNQDCGGCGVLCDLPNATETCNTGICSLLSCSAGFADCSQRANAPGCETRLGTPQDCNACGNVCETEGVNVSANVCQGRAPSWDCAATCIAGWKSCDNVPDNGCETDIETPEDCGDCNRVCNLERTATHDCVGGTCHVVTCDPGFVNCDGRHENGCEQGITTDPRNCGGCQRVCNATNGTPGCSAGTCTISCAAGFDNCNRDLMDGCETDVTRERLHCGACGRPCSGATPFCVASQCAAELRIEVVSSTNGSVAAAGQSLTLAHSLASGPGRHRAVVVGVAGAGNNGAGAPRTVTYAGILMTPASQSPGGQVHAAIYYLTEDQLPRAPGMYNLVITAADPQNTFGFSVNVLELRGVQRAVGAIEASASAEGSGCQTPSSSVNVASPGAIVYGVLAAEGSIGSGNPAGSGQLVTLRTPAAQGRPGALAGRIGPVTSPGPTELVWSQTPCVWRSALVAIQPAQSL